MINVAANRPLELVARFAHSGAVTISAVAQSDGAPYPLRLGQTEGSVFRWQLLVELRTVLTLQATTSAGGALTLSLSQDGVVLWSEAVLLADSANSYSTALTLEPQSGSAREQVFLGPRTTSDQKVRRDDRPAVVEVGKIGRDDAELPVWYATNRKLVNPIDVRFGYSGERDEKLHYGICRVFIPRSHKIGSTGSSWWKRLVTMTDDRVRVISVEETNASVHWETMARRLRSIAVNDRHALLFVHGFNVTFEEAALRAAQIGFDLSVKGPIAFFSWPSRGVIRGYMEDAAAIEGSEALLAAYLAEFKAKSGADVVHIVAHSMGNRGVLRALGALASENGSLRFGQIILAAADVDADVFRHLVPGCSSVSRRTTLYVSDKDRAVEASHWLHGFARAGLVPPVTTSPGVDTIAVSDVDLTLLGHGFVADCRPVLMDMHSLLFSNQDPADRFGLRREATSAGDVYWALVG